jgi:hypothetical protein
MKASFLPSCAKGSEESQVEIESWGGGRKEISGLSEAIDKVIEETFVAETATIRRRVVPSRDGRFRSMTIGPKRLTRDEKRLVQELVYPENVERPHTREDCLEMPRPCPFVSCEHHLYLDVNPDSGAIKLNFPHLEVWEMPETCSLDVADRGGITLEDVGAILNLTRERIRQVEVRGLVKIRMGNAQALGLSGPSGERTSSPVERKAGGRKPRRAA